MTAILLATLLNLSPGVRLADDVKPRNVALSEARLPLQFVVFDDAIPPQPPPPPPLDDPNTPPPADAVGGLSRADLTAQLRRMDETRPSLGGPIVMISLGTPLLFLGTLVMAVSIPYIVETVIGALILTGGVALVGLGIFFLITRIPTYQAWAADRDRLDKKLKALGGPLPDDQPRQQQPPDNIPPQPPPPPPDDVPPPPPPPPPQANLVVPGPMQTVFVF